MFRRCKRCGCYLDPGEWCGCEQADQPEQDIARRPVAKQPTILPREYNTESYIRQRWLEYDMR